MQAALRAIPWVISVGNLGFRYDVNPAMAGFKLMSYSGLSDRIVKNFKCCGCVHPCFYKLNIPDKNDVIGITTGDWHKLF